MSARGGSAIDAAVRVVNSVTGGVVAVAVNGHAVIRHVSRSNCRCILIKMAVCPVIEILVAHLPNVGKLAVYLLIVSSYIRLILRIVGHHAPWTTALSSHKTPWYKI